MSCNIHWAVHLGTYIKCKHITPTCVCSLRPSWCLAHSWVPSARIFQLAQVLNPCLQRLSTGGIGEHHDQVADGQDTKMEEALDAHMGLSVEVGIQLVVLPHSMDRVVSDDQLQQDHLLGAERHGYPCSNQERH